MSEKIYICKMHVDIRMVIKVFVLAMIAFMIFYLSEGISNMGISVCICAIILFLYKVYEIEIANKMIQNGELVWCKIDKMKSEKFGEAVIVHTNYYWKESHRYISYQGAISLYTDEETMKYVSLLQKEKYIPVFVDSFDRNKYAIALWDIQYTKDEIIAQNRQKQVIRVIDKYQEVGK